MCVCVCVLGVSGYICVFLSSVNDLSFLSVIVSVCVLVWVCVWLCVWVCVCVCMCVCLWVCVCVCVFADDTIR